MFMELVNETEPDSSKAQLVEKVEDFCHRLLYMNHKCIAHQFFHLSCHDLLLWVINLGICSKCVIFLELKMYKFKL